MSTLLLQGCISTPERVNFTQPNSENNAITVPEFTSSKLSKEGVAITALFPEKQYKNFPSKLVFIIENNRNSIIDINPKDQVLIQSNINLHTYFGDEAKSILTAFANSAFGKDCKVDPARTMHNYQPPQGWNAPLKAVEVASGQSITGYVLVDPATEQLTQLNIKFVIDGETFNFELDKQVKSES
ncbi:hypothetical protein [Ferrimonas aestuarii]|uniref:Uncharacterized protein n=1 Tax=Ferrimonas aestuarii TaxID=2569539 RepID=A0A4U1BQD3_9GAMM|nr:hypothetical protein [Ferrimonas aestuarii]TKB54987.1 hypothetical protein FCL42_10495 [Ferrimonas aestuarii]